MVTLVRGSRFSRSFAGRSFQLRWAAIGAATVMLGAATACINGPAVLTQQVEARRLAADLRVQFTKAADASNRAVMANTDETSAAAAREAERATRDAEQTLAKLEPILQSLGYADEIQSVGVFKTHFQDYRTLDQEILSLAVENTNLKAQRLSFGEARAASNAFRESLESAARRAPPKDQWHAAALAARAAAAVLEIQVTDARHIAESDEAAMTQMEKEMAASEAAARDSMKSLAGVLPADARSDLGTATTALDRFAKANAEIVSLSRRNSNVRSLAMALGRKRTLTAECDDALRNLQDALGKHEFRATR
jgi:hypothetical protein